MTIYLEIPDSIAQAMRVPEPAQKRTLLIELAATLYAQNVLSFGKARELAQMDKYSFGQLLGQRQIPRHYGKAELKDDLTYADG